jgi:hypothetical protein
LCGASLAVEAVAMCTRFVSFAICLMLLAVTSASAQDAAQPENRFAFGGEFKVKTSDRASGEDYARGQLGPGLLWRFGTPKSGWGFHWGFNWYAVTLERPVANTVVELGELHIRPIMAGYGYTHLIRHYAITADVLGGYAIGSIAISDLASAAYRRSLGVATAEANASNSIVLKPEIGVWYDITKKVYLNVNAGYMFARPDVEIVTTAGIDKRKARADQFILKVGVVYSLF